eukprot:1660484-Amphidinium_carterae.1
MGKMFASGRKEGGHRGKGVTAKGRRHSKHKVLEEKRQEVGVQLRACVTHITAKATAIPARC